MKTAVTIAASTLIIFILNACARFQPLPDSMDAFIEPAIKGNDREVISRMLRLVPEQYRSANIIYSDSEGRIYANKVSLLNDVEPAVRSEDGFYKGERTGEIYRLPDPNDELTNQTSRGGISSLAHPNTCLDGGTGPYRRVKTAQAVRNPSSAFANARFSYQSASLTLPGGSFSVNGRQSATPFAYIGGWGDGGPDKLGTKVDAGFQYSARYNTWDLFMAVDSPSRSGAIVTPSTGTLKYLPGNQLLVEFIVPVDDIVQIRVTGTRQVTRGGTATETDTLIILKDAPTWRANGVGNSMARVTSVAFSKVKAGPSIGRVLGVEWFQARLGSKDPLIDTFGLHAWGSASFDLDVAPNGNCLSAPPPGTVRSTITVDSLIGVEWETVSILLNP